MLAKWPFALFSFSAFLRPKAHSLLAHLARNMGRVVPKSELMDTIWPNVYVTENSLTQSIREIRKALGSEGPDLIRTVARRGYMLAGKSGVTPESGSQPIVAVLRFRNESGEPVREPIVDWFGRGHHHRPGALRLAYCPPAQLELPVSIARACRMVRRRFPDRGSFWWKDRCAVARYRRRHREPHRRRQCHRSGASVTWSIVVCWIYLHNGRQAF